MTEPSPADERGESQRHFRALVSEYLDSLRFSRGLSENTVKAYSADLDSFCSWAEREGVLELGASHREIRRYLAELSRAGYDAKTVNRHLSAMRGLYRWLLREGETTSDAADALSGRKVAKVLPRTLTDGDMRSVIDCCGDDCVGVRDRALVELLYASGARISEVAGLSVGDIDFAEAQVRLFGKGAKERIVPLYPRCLDAIQRYLSESRPILSSKSKGEGPGDALFVSTRGNAMSAATLRRAFEGRLREAGIASDATPHAVRHTYATELLSGGSDLKSVQELLGHASLSTTQIYTHLSVDRLRDAAKQAHPRGQ